jgi:hypothetical protein
VCAVVCAGDLAPIRQHYEGIQRWVETVTAQYNQTGLVNLYSNYGDWVAIDQATNPHIATSFAYLHDILTFINMSQLLHNDTKEFHAAFFNNNSTHPGYADNLQAANIFALSTPGVVPDSLRAAVLNTLVSDIEARDALYSEGFVSISLLWPLLSTSGHHDLAVHLATQTKYPSYGFMRSATTHFVPTAAGHCCLRFSLLHTALSVSPCLCYQQQRRAQLHHAVGGLQRLRSGPGRQLLQPSLLRQHRRLVLQIFSRHPSQCWAWAFDSSSADT